MSELALKLIREAKEQRLTRLDLGNCGLTELPDELFELVWLEELILAGAWLELERWKVKESSNQGARNQIQALSGQIRCLTKLRQLIATENRIRDLAPLASLNQLQTLDLESNQISDLAPLTSLNQLQTLHLNSNQISDLAPLASLNQLQTLHLDSNQISDLRPIQGLIQQGRSINLKKHDFGNNIRLFNNPLTSPPKEVVEQGNEAILNYFKSLEEQGSEPLNEAKLIIVGEPGAGKTSLMETLLDPKFVLCDTTSTLGVEVREGWQFTNPEKSETHFTANIWDFGGQQIQYMTHQFFLTPSAVYVLVSANDRKEPTNFPYWFKIIHLLGEEQGRYSPVLVVLNEKDDKFINKFNFDRKFYEERYPELQIEVCEVDLSKRDEYFQIMRNTVQRMLSQLPHVADPRPARWKDIRDDLRARSQTANHIDLNEYKAICSKNEVKDEQSQLVFSRYLHKLGSLLHFTDDPSLHNFIILKPQWAVDAVYSVLNDNQVAKNDGYFNRAQLETIWKDKYNFDERCKLLSLMQKENFEICYELSQHNFIAPQLLNAERPKFIWDEKDNLRFRFQYKFMPEGIITRLIVRLNSKLARGIENKQLIWRKGAVFTDHGCRALVQEEENRDGLKIINIAINGKVSERKYLLRQISNEIQDIHSKWFRNIKVEQMIPCNCETCNQTPEPTFFAFDELQQYLDEGESHIKCRNGRIKNVAVKLLLEGVFEPDEANQLIHRRETIMTGSTYNITVGNGSQLNLGNNSTQKSNSDNTTITTTTVTSDQRKIIGSVADQLWERRESLDKTQRKTVRNLQEAIEAEPEDTDAETQSKLGKAWQELQGITDFTNNSLEVGSKVAQHWPAITGWLTAVGTYFGG
ncbi:MAG: COR domain-containing protein [Thiolinea sp.]